MAYVPDRAALTRTLEYSRIAGRLVRLRYQSRNADQPYSSASDAMRYWPETATAVGVRLNPQGRVEVNAPLGLDDLFKLIVRPTERFLAEKHSLYVDRVHSKNWQSIWPQLTIQISD